MLRTPEKTLLGGAKDCQDAHQPHHSIHLKSGTSLAPTSPGLRLCAYCQGRA